MTVVFIHIPPETDLYADFLPEVGLKSLFPPEAGRKCCFRVASGDRVVPGDRVASYRDPVGQATYHNHNILFASPEWNFPRRNPSGVEFALSISKGY